MLEMSRWIDGDEAEYYISTAKEIMSSVYENYAVSDFSKSNGLVLHSTYSNRSPYNTCNHYGVDECNIWGDYFYMEGISRLLWGFVPLFAGGHRNEKWQEIFKSALTEGTDPSGKEFWGSFSDKDQKFVEMAAISYGMLFARESVWDILDDKAKDNLAAFLYPINEYTLPECNWVLFAVLVNLAAAYPVGIFSPQGHGQSVAKYGKFVYDTCFGFNVAKSSYNIFENSPDSMLAFEVDGDCHVRRISLDAKISEKETWSRWNPCPGILVETTIVPDENGHTRYHKITSEIECYAYDTGFAVACRDEDNAVSSAEGSTAAAENSFSKCTVSGNGEAVVLANSPNTNVLYRKTIMPAVKYFIRRGETTITTRVDSFKK